MPISALGVVCVDTNQMLFYEALRFFIGPIIKMRMRLKIEGQENVPEHGAAVIVCNHRSALDPVILAYSVRNRYVNFGAASWSWKVPVYRELHEWAGAFPLTLSGGKGESELEEGLKLLESGEVVGIFPEGGETILDPGRAIKIKKFKTGFARLALRARVPVIPCAVVGISERRLPTIPGTYVRKLVDHPAASKGYSSVVYKRAMCRIGRPIDLGGYHERPVTKALLDELAEKMHSVVVKLHDGEELDRLLTGEVPFDFYHERVGGARGNLL